jgi:hypothetical protein
LRFTRRTVKSPRSAKATVTKIWMAREGAPSRETPNAVAAIKTMSRRAVLASMEASGKLERLLPI